LQSNGITFDCRLVWRRAIAAHKFVKNQGFPVFQKLWRFSVQCQLNATWYNAVYRRKVTVVASQRQIQRRFARIPVGGSLYSQWTSG
jgi:hypothetical protein